MRFCANHWQMLRDEVKRTGLDALVPEGGEAAVRAMASEFTDGPTIDNFDPLMMAHNMIWARAMHDIKSMYGQNPLMLMADADEHPDWACPVCALLWCHAEHDRLCKQENCNYPKKFDWETELINGSLVEVQKRWEGMKP